LPDAGYRRDVVMKIHFAGRDNATFIKPLPQQRGLYAVVTSFCLSIGLFVSLCVCRLQRVLLLAARAYRVGQSHRTDLLN